MAKALVAASWLQFPGGNFFVIHLCSFDRDWDGFRKEFVTQDWLEAAHYLRVLLPEDLLGDAIDQLKYHGQANVMSTTSDRLERLGFKPPEVDPPMGMAVGATASADSRSSLIAKF